MNDDRKLKITLVLANRKVSKKIVKELYEKGFNTYFSFYGKGSASSSILEYLGIGETEKDILLYPLGEKGSIRLMECIRNSEYLKELIAFRVPIKGISNIKALNYLLGGNENE